MVYKCPVTSLFSGHKPMSVMIDKRTEKQFAAIVANKDQLTLKFAIF